MANILDTAGDGQELLFGGEYRKEPCRLFVSDKITYSVTKPSKEYKTEVQFHLGTIDPGSVKVSTTKKGTRVGFETTNYESVIWTRVGKWSDPVSKPKDTAGRTPKGSTFKRSAYGFTFLDSAAAGHFTKAFQHAVELCGGKHSAF
jgi:hypothetical protein